MPTITPHLWFENQAVKAAEFYASVFPDARITSVNVIPGTPSGDVETVSFTLWGHPFEAIGAGPLFRFNPSVSFFVSCDSVDEVDALWSRLSDGGTALMPLGSYPFSERYGWTEDRYGISWQVGHAGGHEVTQRITPTLLFVGEVCGKAEEAITLYTSLLPDAGVGEVDRYGKGEDPEVEGTVRYAGFQLAGQQFAAMDSAQDHRFGFNEAVSLMVKCDTQEEIDHYWHGLSAVPEAEQCGWLKDRFGVSWQVVPSAMDEMLRSGSEEEVARVMHAVLAMKKLDLAELERAHAASGSAD